MDTDMRNEPSPDGSLSQKSRGTVTQPHRGNVFRNSGRLHTNSINVSAILKQYTAYLLCYIPPKISSVSVECDDNAGWHPQADAGRCSGSSSLENLTSAASTQREPLADQSQSRHTKMTVPAANQNTDWAWPVTLGMYHCVVSKGDGFYNTGPSLIELRFSFG